MWAALVDAALLISAFTAAFAVRWGWPPPEYNFQPFKTIAPFMVLADLLLHFGFGLYVGRTRFTDVVRMLLMSEAVLFIVTLALAFWLRGFAIPRLTLLLGFAIHLCLLLAWYSFLCRVSQRNQVVKRVMVVAPEPEATWIVRKYLEDPCGLYEPVSAADPRYLLRHGMDDCAGIDLIAIGSSVPRADRERLIRLAVQSRIEVQVLPDLCDILLQGSSLGQVSDAPVLNVVPLGLTPVQVVTKRALDLLLAVPLAICALPVMAVVWVLIKCTSPGPAIYRQERVGLNGRVFTLYKFRTMVVDAEKDTGPVLAKQNDSRITPVGRVLRATRLDELPQLWNVLRGEMSLVGPRPERPFFVESLSREIPDYWLRHVVRPGITGLAQVMGTYATDPVSKLRFDLLYIRHYSIFLDLQLLLLSLRAVVSRDSAAGVASSERDPLSEIAASIVNRSFTPPAN